MLVHRPCRFEVLRARNVPPRAVVPVVQLELQQHRDRHATEGCADPPDQPGVALLQEHREAMVVVVPRGDVLLVVAAHHGAIRVFVARNLVPWMLKAHTP